jgi:methanethiol S-methyltransferase
MTLSFWLILFDCLLWGLLHSLLASLRVKSVARRWFGVMTGHWYRLVFNFVAGITLLPILLLPVLLSDKEIYIIHIPWLLATLTLQILAVATLVIGLRQTGIMSFLGLRQIYLPEDASPPKLVTDGLYRYVRHPLYTAGLVLLWLTPIMTWNYLALALGLTVYIFIGIYFEERKLVLEFGESYAEYRHRTPMLFPKIRLPRITANQ